ncbi:pyridoxine 5'-phosphate synthase [Pseudogemmobacter bohemicus]|uniref:pyridoxine 5'-phosphate synthase n=1 Tax=Pseudogemmobacter bohemicus TaxID=2250708 RepID=UPI000DD3E6F7|nr:pyridoxine 5'-phosphate synthase [Pseudogemmobacter bohemicus]
MADRDRLRLGISVDHVATLRNARSAVWPDPLRAAMLAEASGADGITAHLREDRSHLRDDDIEALMAGTGIPLHLKCSPGAAMLAFLLRLKPQSCCLLPEADGPGGLDVAAHETALRRFIQPLREAGIRVSILIEPEPAPVEAAARIGAAMVELNSAPWSGHHANGEDGAASAALGALRATAALAVSLGLEVHAGNGLTYENVEAIAAIPGISTLHIGHFLIGEAVYIGLGPAIEEMRRRIDAA